MDDYNHTPCSNCHQYGKTIRIDENSRFYIECDCCGFTTPHFAHVIQAQLNWMVGGYNGTSMPLST